MTPVRSLPRVSLGLLVVFGWKDGKGTHEGRGVTRDISAMGMYVMVSECECPPPSTVVRCQLVIPSLDAEAPNAVLEGISVGRVTRKEEGCGFAIRNKRFILRDPQP